ncbi:hypothetical protein CVT25_007958 [Psilocybe cyanescens]|uniref:Uncharacterized protein n=1 Tax=Psilocybe cyanescens TaxID=93625 RepID=A0A409XN32_PSICY|nr:hypothetical protein CVT25_007958 [Psilocybe cyanescens]
MSTNKLKKQPPIAMSATLTLASADFSKRTPYDVSYEFNSNSSNAMVPQRHKGTVVNSSLASSTASATNTLPMATTTTTMNIQPMSAKEQYWATRALKAEALLAAHEDHKKEIKNLGYVHDMKRERELVQLAKEHKEKHDTLDKLVKFLAGLIIVLVAVIVYLATHYARHSMLLQYKQQEKWWSMIGASHFTIPILSPFTSVVEHESSVVGAKMIGTVAAIAACLVFLGFRHWLASRDNQANQAAVNANANAIRGGAGVSAVTAIASAIAPVPYSIDR